MMSSLLHTVATRFALAVVLIFSARASVAAVRVEAFRGEPFGIGRITIDLQGAAGSPANDDRFGVEEANDRVLYPVAKGGSGAARRMLRNILGVETPQRVTYYFMFRGDEPLELVAYSPGPQSISVRPEDNAREFDKLLDDWWEATTDHYGQVFRQAEYPIVVENYLTATWARRLNRSVPEPKRYLSQRFGVGAPWISQLMANEAYQSQVERDLLAGAADAADAELVSLPVASTPQALSNRTELPSSVEPIAAHVPNNCFYVRFGNFTNYLWFRDFLRHWQGDLGNMIAVESVERNISERFQQQIAVGESKLARVMGSTVINDVAIIGLDAYLRDGAAMGILFQANSTALLRNNLDGQRHDAKAKNADAVEETLKIAGHDVSYIHTPDNRLRSFYALDGDFHLVTNCRALVERFYQAGARDGSLAGTADFQECRAAMPLTRDDTIFVFAPAEFLQDLASPHYRVELDRRLRSIGEIRAIRLARLAAVAEDQPTGSLEDLINADLLPASFGQHFDGSALESAKPAKQQANKAADDDLVIRDSLRGDAGWMTPIPDVKVDRITAGEARRLAKFQTELAQSVGSFAPVCVALKRTDSATHKGWDQITADVRVARYSQMPVAKWPKMLGEAQTNRVAPIEGDAVSLEVVLGGLGEPMHVFGGIRDFNTPLYVRQGDVQTRGSVTDAIRAYVGSWPRPSLLDQFLGRPAGPLDADGVARTGGLLDLWFRRADDFFMFSFKRDVLLEVGRQLAMVEAEHPAQIRLHIDDLTEKQISTAVNGIGYKRARDTSASSTRFMNSLSTQLHVAPADARALGEELVGGKFVCTLGGKYELVDNADRKLWVSTAPPIENRFLLTVIPTDYQMPLMTWFRGLNADVARANDELWLNAKLDMTHIEVGPPEDPDGAGGGISLPSIGNLFGGFGAKRDDAVKPASGAESAPTKPSSK